LPGTEGIVQGAGLVGEGGGEVFLLGDVGFEIEQLDAAVFKRLDEFVVALADGAEWGGATEVAWEVPVHRFALERSRAPEQGSEAFAVQDVVFGGLDSG